MRWRTVETVEGLVTLLYQAGPLDARERAGGVDGNAPSCLFLSLVQSLRSDHARHLCRTKSVDVQPNRRQTWQVPRSP